MLRNLRIAQRSILFFSILGAITLFLGIFALSQQNRLAAISSELGEVRLVQVNYTGAMQRAFLGQRLWAATFALSAHSPEQQKRMHQQIQESKAVFAQASEALARTLTTEAGVNLVKQVNFHKSQYDQVLEAWVMLLGQGNTEAADELRLAQLTPSGAQALATLEELVELELAVANNTVQEARMIESQSHYSILFAIVFSMVLVVVLAVLFSRSLIQPLQNAVVNAQRIASGDLTLPIIPQGKDEAADMMQALSQMQEQLRDTLGHILDSSHQLAATSEELAVITNQSSQIVHEQGQQLEQAATAINELTVAVDEVANSANITSDNAEQVNTGAQAGQAKLLETRNTIGRLVEEIGNTSTGISELAEDVKKISHFIDVISDVAEQTNLLALNAAIEAARAGESGRGFAVVADEVRGLAHRTQESTHEIEEMIASVQAKTELVVKNMNTSNEWALTTRESADDVVEVLGKAAVLIGEINEQNLNIASAAEEQAMVAREVDQNLVSIRDLSIQTTEGANETNASSHELSRLAANLNELLKRFKIS